MASVRLGSRVGLGTAPLGSDEAGPLWWGPQDRAAAVATVRAAFDVGIDWIDTAPFYGWGRAEDGSPAAVHADLEASLRRLGTDHVDVLQLHPTPTLPCRSRRPSPPSPNSSRRERSAPSDSPTIRSTCCSVVTAWRRLAVVQHQWSILHHPPEVVVARDWCVTAGGAIIGARTPAEARASPITPDPASDPVVRGVPDGVARGPWASRVDS